MKIQKLNKQGTLGIVIPKDIAEALGWKAGQEVIVDMTDFAHIIGIHNITLKEDTKSRTKNLISKNITKG